MNDLNGLISFCTGCGLCHSLCGTAFHKDKNGFLYPDLDKSNIDVLTELCPYGGKASVFADANSVWGKYQQVFLGWSLDDYIRKTASSGGILTAICCYLLENNIVDGIIQTKVSSKIPYETETVVSKTKAQVLQCMGSRYSESQPLKNIIEILNTDKTYAFVGKPCDASVLRLFLKTRPEYRNKVKYIFSFFCAGVPSEHAQHKLLEELGCQDINDCSTMTYRGNGWPGFASAIKKDGTVSQISYSDSWGKILGRDVRRSCRFCIDGVGEAADIACGDAWYLTDDKKPDFREKDGRNVVFARSETGKELLSEIQEAHIIALEDYQNSADDLYYIQKYQYERKASMLSMINALKLFRKDYPRYDKKILKSYAKLIPCMVRFKRFAGTIKRIKKGKI